MIGPIEKIDGHYYYVKDEESGDQIRLVMDEGTRVTCSLQTASGPSGDCAFKPGDRVWAEVSDLGTVTTIRPPPSQTAHEARRSDALDIAGPGGGILLWSFPSR